MAKRRNTRGGDTRAEQTTSRVPPPINDGTETQQSLGRWLDDLLGDRRARVASRRNLAALVMAEEEKPDDPPPSEPPPPVPGGTETITKGGRPSR